MAKAKKKTITCAPKVARVVAAIEPATPTEKHEAAVSLGGAFLIDEKGGHQAGGNEARPA